MVLGNRGSFNIVGKECDARQKVEATSTRKSNALFERI